MSKIVFVWASLTCFTCAALAEANKDLRVGFLVPMEGSWDEGRTMAPATPLAIEALSGDPLLDGWRLKLSWRNSACSPGKALAATTDLLSEGIDFLLGPSCSVACEPTQLLASTINLAQVNLPGAHRVYTSSLISSFLLPGIVQLLFRNAE